MSASILTPLHVMGLGIIISYGIALLIKVLLIAIRVFTKKQVVNEI